MEGTNAKTLRVTDTYYLMSKPALPFKIAWKRTKLITDSKTIKHFIVLLVEIFSSLTNWSNIKYNNHGEISSSRVLALFFNHCHYKVKVRQQLFSSAAVSKSQT